jgi:Na+/H+-translocating membrane pyrophosphatase
MTWLFFLIFLGVYAYQQYFSPAPTTVDQPFVMNALLVLSITVIAPFFISYFFTRATQMTGRVPAILLGFISAIGLSVFGYWIVWKYFSGLSLQPVPIETALQMGLIPGVIMGIILATDSLFRRSH